MGQALPPGQAFDSASTARNLLLVDGDRVALSALDQALRMQGYLVAAADCAEQALRDAQHARFDLAVLDIRMPGLSGIELAHVLEQRHGLRSLFLSVFGDRAQAAAAIREGALGYLLKPVDTAQLIPAIETALARARDLDALAATQRQLEQALAENRGTSIAIGILMARRNLSEAAAFSTLREEARRQRRKLSQHCSDIVASLPRQDPA